MVDLVHGRGNEFVILKHNLKCTEPRLSVFNYKKNMDKQN